jgi:hypothetical protein
MPYRYDCTTCKPKIVYFSEASKVRPKCPKCRTVLTFMGQKKIKPKWARNLDLAVVNRSPRAKSRREALVNEKRAMVVAELDEFLEDEGFSEDEFEEEDDAWAPPPQYSIGMRLTSGTRRACRGVYPNQLIYIKAAAKTRIAPSPGRGNQNGVMGKHILGLGGGDLSAQSHAGRGSLYTVDKFTSLEWCHLIADSLGGPTTPANLVAASFGCNTEMNVIEHRLQGRTELDVQVTAECNANHIAEMITYNIYYGTKLPIFTRKIDAYNDHFTKEDMDDLEVLLKTWFKQVGLSLNRKQV